MEAQVFIFSLDQVKVDIYIRKTLLDMAKICYLAWRGNLSQQ